MEDALVHKQQVVNSLLKNVLILVVMEDALVRTFQDMEVTWKPS